MGNENCKGYNFCKAPLCPLDNSFTKAVWYGDEPICSIRSTYTKERWHKNQKKIAKVNAQKPVEGYFTVEYLSNLGRVTSKVHGIIPGSRTETIRNKPKTEVPKRILSPEHIEKMRLARTKALKSKPLSLAKEEPRKAKRVLTPEHLAKLKAGREKVRAH
jgi:hypothetical protein